MPKVFSCSAIVFLANCSLIAATPKEADDVDIWAMTQECQSLTLDSRYELVWWIPSEFWNISLQLHQDDVAVDLGPAIEALRPYAYLAVLQADVLPSGSYEYYNEQSITDHMQVTWTDSDSRAYKLEPLVDLPEELAVFLEGQIQNMRDTLGQVGGHLVFFTFKVQDPEGNWIASPYRPGSVRVKLTDQLGENESQHTIQFPLNSLFVPRKCPNGQDAHISWKFCPWTGEALPE